MTVLESKALEEIETLVQERKKFEGWIEVLGERRSVTAPHVFERVLRDYHSRVRDVAEKLHGRSSEIESSIAELRARLKQLQKEETETADERAEAELRAAVGEYSSDKWEEVRRVADERISGLSATRLELDAELEHLDRLLEVAVLRPTLPDGTAHGSDSGSSGGAASALMSPGSVPRMEAEPAAHAAASTSPSVAAESASASNPTSPASGDKSAAAPAPNAPPARSESFDELAFLSSVVETEIAQLKPVQADNPPKRAPSGSAEVVRPSQDTERPRPRVSETPSASRIVRAPTPLITEPVRSGMGDGESGHKRDEQRISAHDRKLSGSVPAYLRDVPKEAAKSLKCQECGSMNYPTEWYCERCGGELAAL